MPKELGPYYEAFARFYDNKFVSPSLFLQVQCVVCLKDQMEEGIARPGFERGPDELEKDETRQRFMSGTTMGKARWRLETGRDIGIY